MQVYLGSGMIVKGNLTTCKHNFKDSDNSDFYFITSNNLDPETGWPKWINDNSEFSRGEYENITALDDTSDADTQIRIKRNEYFNNKFIENMEASVIGGQFTGFYKIKKGTLKGSDSVTISDTELMNDDNFKEDIVTCEVEKPDDHFEDSDKVNINTPAEKSFVYYALGYPIISYLPFSEKLNPFMKNKIAPFTRTASKISLKSPEETIAGYSPGIKIYEHHAPTSGGMSGGPILTLDIVNGQITVIGIIAGGKQNKNYIMLLAKK